MWNTSGDSLNENFNTILKQEFTETFQLSKFEVKTLASLVSDECFSNVSVRCISSSAYIVIAIENKLSVFKEDSQQLFWELEFDSRCDYVTLSDDLGLLLAVEHPGTLHLLHLPSSKTVWSSDCEYNGSSCTVQNTFICPNTSGSLSVYVFTKEGILFEISNIETSALYKALEEERVSEFFSRIHVEKKELSSLLHDFSIKSAFETFCQTCPLGLEIESKLCDLSSTDYYTIEDMVDGDFTKSHFMSDWEVKDEERKFKFYNFSGYGEMKKVVYTRDHRYIICLDDKGTLLTFSSFTHLNLGMWGDGDIKDFVLYYTLDSDTLSISECKIGILQKYGSTHIYEVRKFPSFEFVYKVQLLQFAQLVDSKPNQDSWYVLEGNQPFTAQQQAFLKIVSVSEARPEARLLSLLNRRKFKEAEKYAKMCNLDDEIIFKTKINCMLKDSNNQVGNLTKHELDSLWKEVEESLNKIKDVEFIKSCISLLVPEIEVMEKFLSSIHKWLVASNIEGAEDLISEINKNENKFSTYNVLPDSIRSNLAIKDFLKKDLLQYMITELISGCLATALIIWQRHKNELLSSLSTENVGEVLNAIPGDIPSQHLIPFLEEDFLPSVLSKLPDTVEIVADWIISRIYLLELNEKESWPENGDKLASMFLELIEASHKRAGKGGISYSTSVSLAYIHKKLISTDFRVGCLYDLSKNLKLLVNLKENFNCKISLTTFQDSKMDVIFAVLDRIKLKFISEAVSQFARPFTLENDLDLDLCLELYIEHTLKTSYFTWWSWDEAPWEEHLTHVLECIHNSSHWIKAALFLVSHATVPWSDRVKNIVQQGLNSDHPSKEEFEQQSKKVHLKEVLLKYEIRNFPINSKLQLVYTLVNYILKQNRASAFEDAKMVILSCNESLDNEHYKKFLQFFLNQNKLDELISLHSSIPSKVAVECSNTLLRYITFGLEDSFLVENDKEQMNTFLNAGIYFIEFLKSKKQPVNLDLLGAFRSMKKLQKEFDISATLCDVTVRENALKIVENYIHSFLDEEAVAQQRSRQSEKNNTTVAIGIFKTKRLGHILDLETENIMALLVTSCLQRKKYDLVIKLCGELVSSHPSSQNAKTLLRVVNHFYENFQNIKNLSFETIIATVCHLSNLAVTCCDSEMIKDCMYAVRLSTYFAVLNKITGQPLFLSRASIDNYHKWRFHPVYEDEVFQLDISQVVDFVIKLLPLFLRNHNNLEKAVDFPMQEVFSILFKPAITQMKEKGQAIAAVRTMYLFYHLQMDFFQNAASTQEAFMLIAKDVKDIAFYIIQRIVDKRKLDLELSIGLLFIYPNQQIQILEKLQRWSAKDLRCILSLGEIGTECCRVLGNHTKCLEYDKIYRRALLLLRHNIKYTEAEIVLNSTDSDYNWEVVKEIILSPKITLSTIFECCSAFDLVTDHVLIAYLNNVLVESEKMSLTSAELPEEDLKLMLSRAKCAIEAITSEEIIVKNLEKLLKKISSYSYEVLLFIHEQLLCASANFLTITSGQFEKTLALLNFLMIYQRVSPPGEIELESWISLHPTDMKFPLIASKRLPFWMFFEDTIFKIINPELTSNTLVVWMRIAPLLKISKDDLVMIAVKNNVMAYLKKLPTNYLLVSQDKTFLHNIRDMLVNISDPQATVACASWVANRMPPGGNKVCSCMIAMRLADNWKNMSPNDRNPLDILKKSTVLYERSAVEGILYQNNLANDVSLSYAHNPVQLIEYFTEEFFLSAESSIKVCKAADEINKIVDINLDEIFCKYFFKWLNVTQTVINNLDESFGLNDSTEGAELEDTNEKNILRAINLILGASTINHNICEIMKKNYNRMTFTQRSRFIFCTIAVYGLEYAADSLKMSLDVLDGSLPAILYSSELECLHMLYSKEMISTTNLLELIHSILCNQSNNSKAVLCCVRICLEHNVWRSEIWDILLQRLVTMSLVESLEDILQTAQGQLIHMWHYKSFISAWNCIISKCFKSELTDLPKVIEIVYKTILGCPCAKALDVESLWNDFKYFVKSINGKNLEDKEPISDVCTFIQVLKTLQENS